MLPGKPQGVRKTLACKSFALVDNQRDVFRLFEDGKHLVKFTNADNLKEKITWYLEHPQNRQEIAENGYREVTAKHTYFHRIDEMLTQIQKDKDKTEYDH